MNKSLLLLLFVLSQSVCALLADSSEPINVEAQQVMVDKTNGVSIYSGDVVVTQGTLELKANELTVYHTDKKVSKMIAIGTQTTPAWYRQLPENETDYVEASAITMVYRVNDNFLELEDEAVLTQGQDTFSGDKVQYDIGLDKVLATSEDKDSRVKFKFNYE